MFNHEERGIEKEVRNDVLLILFDVCTFLISSVVYSFIFLVEGLGDFKIFKDSEIPRLVMEHFLSEIRQINLSDKFDHAQTELLLNIIQKLGDEGIYNAKRYEIYCAQLLDVIDRSIETGSALQRCLQQDSYYFTKRVGVVLIT